jgi:hypothetical protein
MSIWSKVRAAFGDAPDTESAPPQPTGAVESGLPQDTGGAPDATGTDTHSSTGSSPNDEIVGRAGGDDQGYLESGAERRAEED